MQSGGTATMPNKENTLERRVNFLVDLHAAQTLTVPILLLFRDNWNEQDVLKFVNKELDKKLKHLNKEMKFFINDGAFNIDDFGVYMQTMMNLHKASKDLTRLINKNKRKCK